MSFKHNQIFNLSLTIFLFSILFSCQKEVVEISDAQENTKLTSNSTLTTLITQTVTKDGSVDNIIDKANCLEVVLPVLVVVNGTSVEIKNKEDYEVIEEIFDRFNDDVDKIDIQYPIKLVTSSFNEVQIRNENELKELVQSCNGENEIDADIECIDFMYPISISVFDTDFDIANTRKIDDDANLFKFLKNLDASTIASIKFPITLIKADGTLISVNNNNELESTISQSIDTCDEDDNFNFNDDDPDYCNVDFVQRSLERCIWNIIQYINNPTLEEFSFRFSNDNTFTVNKEGNIEGFGTWSITQASTSEGKNILKLSSNVNDFDGEWEILECGDTFFEITQNDNLLKIGRACPDFTSEAVEQTLLGCNWLITDFIENGNNVSDQYSNYRFDFKPDETFEITDNTTTFPGAWVIEENGFGDITVNISSSFSGFSGNYFIASLENSKVVLQSNLGSTIKLEKDCDVTNGIDIAILDCVWKVSNLEKNTNSLTSNYDNFRFKFFDDGLYLLYNITNPFVYFIGDWLVVNSSNGNQESFLITSNTFTDPIFGFYTIDSFDGTKLYLRTANDILELEKDCM